MKRIIFILFLMFGSLNLYGNAQYTCPGEDVVNVNGATDNATASYDEVGKDVSTNGGRYFKFQTNVDGIITISEHTLKNKVGYKNHKLLVGTSCGGKNIYKGKGRTSDTVAFKVSAGTMYYVKVQEANTKNQLNFHIDFDFKKNSGSSNAQYTCQGEDVVNVNGATDNATASYDEVGKDVGKNGGRYFKFQTNVDGTITISEYTLKNQVGYKNHKLLVGTSCGRNDIYNGKGRTSDTVTFNVSKGTTYYVKVQEANTKNQLNFHIDFDFEKKANSTVGIYHNGEMEFHLVNPSDTRNIIGNTLVIGNTVECIAKDYYDYEDDYGDEYYNYPNSISQLQSSECSNDLTENDNNYFVKYIDVDGNSSTFNSSSATVVFPSTYKKIKWAGLFWQGHINSYSYQYLDSDYDWHLSNDFPGDIKNTNASKVKIKIGNGPYHEVTANEVDYFNDNRFIWGLGKRYGVEYSAYADITNILDTNLSSNTTITVADIVTSRGLESSLGDYGAWTLVIVYEENETNPDSKLRNNSVFYGYKQIYKNHPDTITVSGFLLPKHGTVDSQMAVFAGEGEYTYHPDYMKLDGTELGSDTCNADGNTSSCKTNVFDAKLSPDIQRNPFLTNNNGIDIDVFDTSDIMTAKRNAYPDATSYSSTISLSSNWDMYFPSMVSFTTQLYKPRVCYYIDTIKDDNGVVIFENKHFIKDIEPNKNYHFNLWIANMKKDVNDTDIEDARQVQVYVKMKDGFIYKSNSTSIKNIGINDYQPQTDRSGDDLVDFNYDTNTSTWRVGNGANATEGGTLEVASKFDDNAKKVFIKLEGSFNVDSNSSKIDLSDYYEFKASFRTDSIVISPNDAQTINQCVDLNTTAGIAGLLGSFNVVNRNGGNAEFNNPDSYQNKLYTQTVNRSFSVKIIHLNNALNGLSNYNGEVNVTLINNPYSEGDTDADKQNKCNNATPITSWQSIEFNNENNKTLTFNYNKAIKDARFKIKYIDNGQVKYACSFDDFAIRPDKYKVLAVNQKFIAGKDVNVTVRALDAGNNKVQNFTFNAPVELNITDAMGCKTGILSKPASLQTTLNFINGEANLTINYKEAGDINISVKEYKNGNEFAKVDENDSVSTGGVESDDDLLIGEGNSTISRFYPDKFSLVNTTYHNFKDSSFTYISGDLNMSSYIQLEIAAKAADGTTTTENYNENCYAKNFDINITHSAVPSTMSGEEIVYKDEAAGAVYKVPVTQDINLTNLPKTYFTTDHNGTASFKVYINFDKNYTNPVNEFNFTVNDINMTDADDVNGSIALDQNATFRYGRIKVSNVSGYGSDVNTTFEYQYWTDSDGWVINPDHNNSATVNFGDVNTTITTPLLPHGVSMTLNTVSGGKESVTFRLNTAVQPLPYSAKIHLAIDKWLWYFPAPLGKDYQDPSTTNMDCTTHPCMKVDFMKSGTRWGGVTAINNTQFSENNRTAEINATSPTDTNVSKSQVKKINW